MSNERIILIKGDNSKWYDQAIFIVKKNVPQNKIPIDFVKEAEKIINGYLVKNKHSYSHIATVKPDGRAKKKSSNTFDLFLNAIMLLSCVFITAMLIWAFF